uniref:Activin_recp domain-containing protein n=1 Tax=Strongyloides venezuelensis TaxID=75913 RepID=A0A0K0FYK7_STRVS
MLNMEKSSFKTFFLIIFLNISQYFLFVSCTLYSSNTIACFRGKNDMSKNDACKGSECYTLIHYTSSGIKVRRGCVNKRMELAQYQNDPSYEVFYCNSSSYCNDDTADISKLKSSSGASGKKYFAPISWSMNIVNVVSKRHSPPGGLEPPTFRLTAERASRLRHGGEVGQTSHFSTQIPI